jgi:hypothetical protein
MVSRPDICSELAGFEQPGQQDARRVVDSEDLEPIGTSGARDPGGAGMCREWPFKFMGDCRIASAAVGIAASSGQPQLDGIALKAVGVSARFDSLPGSNTVTIAVVHGSPAKK